MKSRTPIEQGYNLPDCHNETTNANDIPASIAVYQRLRLLPNGTFAGKPAVIMPTFSERESNARRIAAFGAGAIVSVDMTPGKKRVDVDELRATVRRVLSDPSFRDNARKIGEGLRLYGGASQAADIIEQFTQKGNVRSMP